MGNTGKLLRGLLLLAVVLAASVTVRAESCEHIYEEVEIPGTCTAPGIHCYVCSVCGFQYGHTNTDPLGHLFDPWETIDAPECESGGTEQRSCQRCSHTETRNTEALGHSYGAWETTTVAGCKKKGKEQRTCLRCAQTQSQSIPSLGHDYDEGVITKMPTVSAMGRLTHTCRRCGGTYTEKIPRLEHPFTDVPQTAYYYDAVVWSVREKIIKGTEDTLFSPEKGCTRGEAMMLLWKAAGKPKPEGKTCPFSDVAENADYRNAVLWAAEQGIVAGTCFEPERICTRGQFVMFLHHWKETPECSGQIPFLDVTQEDDCCMAVAWAYEQGITQGICSRCFAPLQQCTRAQVVTFLYRAAQKEQ